MPHSSVGQSRALAANQAGNVPRMRQPRAGMVISQHQISTDPRSDIPHNPARTSPDYTVKLIGKVITVGLEGSSSLPHRQRILT